MIDYGVNDPKGWRGDPSRGAALGRPSVHEPGFSGEIRLRRILLDDGGYDSNGTYFGTGQPLWWCASEGLEIDYVLRARDRVEARGAIKAQYPAATIASDADEDMIAEIFDGYVKAALWSSMDGEGNSLDLGRDEHAVADGTRRKMRDVCERFFRNFRELILKADYPARRECSNLEMIGHDLWLTSNGHGAGFGDGDVVPREVDHLLRQAAKDVRGMDLFVYGGKIWS